MHRLNNSFLDSMVAQSLRSGVVRKEQIKGSDLLIDI